jgi:hypothetical protein
MKTNVKIILWILFFAFAISCADEGDPVDAATDEALGTVTDGDALSAKVLDEIDDIPSTEVDASEIVLPNGMSIAEFEAELDRVPGN